MLSARIPRHAKINLKGREDQQLWVLGLEPGVDLVGHDDELVETLGLGAGHHVDLDGVAQERGLELRNHSLAVVAEGGDHVGIIQLLFGPPAGTRHLGLSPQ